MTKARNGSSRAWRKARAAQLASAPYCEDCGRPAIEVDHVLGVANDPDHIALSSVCHPGHVARTTRRLREGGRRTLRPTIWRRTPSQPASVIATTAGGRMRRIRVDSGRNRSDHPR